MLDGKRYDLGSNFATADDAAAAHRTAKCAGRTDRPSPKHERVQRGTGTPLLLLTSIPFLCSMLVVATRMTFGRNEGAQSALVSMSRGCAGVPSKAETLLPSYQTTPCTPRSPPVRPAPPLTRTARLPREQAVGRWLVVDGQAARPKDIFILCGAGGQFVGRAGGEEGAVCSRRGALLAGPLRARRRLAVSGGVGLLTPNPQSGY